MNKKLTLIIAVIFITVNIATYLFATGKVRVVEKFITIYKDKETSGSSSANLKEDAKSLKNEKLVTSLGTANSGKGITHFNDADYPVPNDNKLTDVDIKSNNVNTKAAPENIVTSEIKNKQAITSHNDTMDANIINNNSNKSENYPTEVKITTDENIPLPQLPLFDTDFENNKETGNNNENIALPSLPEIDS